MREARERGGKTSGGTGESLRWRTCVVEVDGKDYAVLKNETKRNSNKASMHVGRKKGLKSLTRKNKKKSKNPQKQGEKTSPVKIGESMMNE